MMGWLGFALLALALMGVGNACLKAASARGLSPGMALLACILAEVPVALLYAWGRGRQGGSQGGLGFALAAGLGMGLALVCLNESFLRPGSRAAVSVAVMNANFAVVALLGLWLFRETLPPAKLLGLAVMGLGLWLLAR